MNLSKIAVGVAVSLCLISNSALSESKSLTGKVYDRTLSIVDEWKAGGEKNEELRKKAIEHTKLFEDLYHVKYNNYGNKRLYYLFDMINDEINKNTRDISEVIETVENNYRFANKLWVEKANIDTVEKNSANILANKISIESNKMAIVENKVTIETNKTAIADNKSKITLNREAIQAVNERLNARIDSLNQNLRRGLATQSALNGLFQPYNVGKVSLTAAVGGYQSNSAIAIGTGYRFNENIAAKAGLSKSVGGSALSYSVGVNYEF
ncbi:YadA C-terminal domain-containing protein [Pasteurella oralis]|uniref:YadA C-terminal domain-containing protein n=1 Tax=Pasteurella oralis TaxID=1071947 RepID=A0ABW4NU19_9PAST